MTSLRSICAAAALTVLVVGPTQGFAMTHDHGGADTNAVTPAAPLITLARGGLFEIEDYSFDIEQVIGIGSH
jgi:hypothetical protein